MPAGTGAAGQALALDEAARAALGDRIERALGAARRERRPVLASATSAVDSTLDPAAAVLRARRADDRFFCLEQPDRGGFALATLGSAATVEARGPQRFAEAAGATRRLARGALCDVPSEDEGAPPASGPVWVGGFAFSGDAGATPEWSSLSPAHLVLPEISVSRAHGQGRLTVCAVLEGDEAPDAVLERLEHRLGELRPSALPLLDPDPAAPARVAGAAPPAHYEDAVARAVDRIRAGELEKVVLAREVRVHAPRPIDAPAVFGALRAGFPACYCYLVGTPELALVGASPELLVRRDGARAQTVALAGTARRSADPAVDRHLGEQLLQSVKDREEQAIVARRIERRLRPVSVWVARAEEPAVISVQNVQHLASPIRAQLSQPTSAIELAGLLHPTPAVGGEPWECAAPLIPALEGLDRGWYASPVGYTDLAEDGEFCVALRCALVRGTVAHLYAGDGIVRDSVPADELAETEVKLGALLPLFA